ncbi:sulfite exporter TauE/SafE family protein [Roseateles koreensis]|uniref:Probable membrane transporter protein n=1 Tax=Roseateles koreensis TaxID=2987526 RepID=A0ABT5KTG0_9BURK|nr:TSUP family transporter [Roseateles koreensis]MDC8785633.1 TSUP family transporter [Roseateles koreensis]
MLEFALLALASLMAGFVDAVVGGGGLILVPTLFSAFPQAAPATLFGTNKAAASWGTAWSTAQYVKRVSLNWRGLLPAAAVGVLGSFAGAWTVTLVDAGFLRRALPLILLAVLVYTLSRKDLGRHHAPRFTGRAETGVAAAIGLCIGFYDGFFGPGTGSFFVFLFVRVLGYDFLNASATAKLMNLGTNLAALALLTAKGHVWWQIGLIMGAANVLGSLVGTRMALARGASFVRGMFVLVVSALILKTGWDAFLR